VSDTAIHSERRGRVEVIVIDHAPVNALRVPDPEVEAMIAAVPGDTDAIWCNGCGFPRFRGGPMFHADTLGLGIVLDGEHRFAETLGRKYWAPAPRREESSS
jgi:hypothetical protein